MTTEPDCRSAMQFFAFITAVLVTVALPATHALEGYADLYCEGEPDLVAPCDGRCRSFENSSSFTAYNRVDHLPLIPRCVTMWTEPGCTGTPYVYSDLIHQCMAVTFPAASFTCENVACSV